MRNNFLTFFSRSLEREKVKKEQEESIEKEYVSKILKIISIENKKADELKISFEVVHDISINETFAYFLNHSYYIKLLEIFYDTLLNVDVLIKLKENNSEYLEKAITSHFDKKLIYLGFTGGEVSFWEFDIDSYEGGFSGMKSIEFESYEIIKIN